MEALEATGCRRAVLEGTMEADVRSVAHAFLKRGNERHFPWTLTARRWSWLLKLLFLDYELPASHVLMRHPDITWVEKDSHAEGAMAHKISQRGQLDYVGKDAMNFMYVSYQIDITSFAS